MTRTVADSALMLEVMAGPHPLDHTTCEAGPADYLARLERGRARQAHRLQPRSRPCARRPGCRGAREGRRGALHRTRRHGRGSEDAVGRARPRTDPLLLGRAPDASRAAPAEMGGADGPGPRRLHQGRTHFSRRGVSGDARAQDGLHRHDPSLVRGLGLPAHAFGVGCRVPRRAADAAALAAARLGLAVVGGVLLSVQHVLEPGRRACRAASPPRACRSACRSSAGASTTSACCRRRRRSSRCSPGRTSGPPSPGACSEAINAFLLGLPALFSIVNPISGAFIFRGR